MVRRKRPPDGRASNGGVGQRTPGAMYANRSDLQAQPVRTATNQDYGKAKTQADSQAAVPVAGQPAPPAPDAHAAAAGFQMPDHGAFDRPTERPDEPLTHGAPVGAGAGPEVLPGMGGPPAGMSGMLRMLAQSTGSSDLEELAQRAESLGQ